MGMGSRRGGVAKRRGMVGRAVAEGLEGRMMLSIPPLQDVQAWVETSGDTTTVKYKVFDPVRAEWKQAESAYPKVVAAPGFVVSGLTAIDGVVAWKASGFDGGTNRTVIGYAVYEPRSGAWQSSWQDYRIFGEQYWDVSDPNVAGGVVAWRASERGGAGGLWSYTAQIGLAVYDAERQQWSFGGDQSSVTFTFWASAGSPWWEYSDPVVSGGMVAWSMTRRAHPVPEIYEQQLDAIGMAIYDPLRHLWCLEQQSYLWYSPISNWGPQWVLSAPQISAQSVTYTAVHGADSESHKWGYDYSLKWWVDVADGVYPGITKPLSCFVASPVSGSPPLTTWIWDSSIGGTSWTLNYGDGGSSTKRGTYHTYTGYGTYTLQQTVSGPGGTNTSSATITTDTIAPAGSIIVNGGADHTHSQTVRLALSATDNSGQVAGMRFSNDGSTWGSWQTYSATATWILPWEEGQRTVYAQFEDVAGNVSNACSDSIVFYYPKAVAIPDPNLEGAVRDALQKATGEITDVDMEGLTELWAASKGISNLSGLEYATNLASLDLDENAIVDLRPLEGLTKLSELYLGANIISELAPLERLTNLGYLRLSYNIISNLEALTELKKLTRLELWQNDISGLTPLGGLTNLEYLGLLGNNISDLTPLTQLENLTTLYLGKNGIRELGPLAGLTKLQYLHLDDNKVSDLSPLKRLTNLEALLVGANLIDDVEPLSELKKLTRLYLYDNQVGDLSPLEGLTNLVELEVGGNLISSLTPLDGLTNLNRLGLESNEIRDLAPLSELKNLQRLSLAYNQISGLSPLERLTNLHWLDLDDNEIGDLGALTELVNLFDLDLHDNQISDIHLLAGLTNLEWLDVAGNYLDQTPGSPAMQVIDALVGAGTQVEYIPQKFAIKGTTSDDAFDVRLNGGTIEVYRSGDPEGQPSYALAVEWEVEALVVDGRGGADTLTVDLGGGNPFKGMGMKIASGSFKLEIIPGPGVLTIDGVDVGASASLDVGDNDMIVTNGDISELFDLIGSARANGAWTGQGITSSAAKDDKNGFTGLGLGTTKKGEILIKYTWNGDANLDGVINADDYFLADSGFITQRGGWGNGDFNYDGVINADDYFLIDSAYIGQSGVLAASKPEAVVSADVAVQQKAKKAEAVGILSQLFSTEPVL
ncbi:MAG: leucine-rich repeat domain-containing protein [Planctomycetota bacterium]|nr:leucine-rich repeat domain-containing protein [Planctomycetota bacterium]